MEVYWIPISKQQLQKFTVEERRLFLQLGHLQNDLAILHKLLVVHHPKGPLPDPAMRAGMGVFFMLTRLLAGKVWEGWMLLQKDLFETHLLESLSLTTSERDSLSRLGRHFSKSKILNLIRNKQAFHYDGDELVESLDALDTFDSCIVLENSVGNCFYGVSEDLMLLKVQELTGTSEPTAAVEKLFKILTMIARQMADVAGGIQKCLVERYIGASPEACKALVMEVPSSPIKPMEISYFVHRESEPPVRNEA